MLRLCVRKVLVSVLGAMVTCLLVLMVDQKRSRLEWPRPEEEMGSPRELRSRSLQSWDNPMDAQPPTLTLVPSPAVTPTPGSEPQPQPKPLVGFREYFGHLDRSRGSRGESRGESPASPAPRVYREDISAADVFVAVKTTKKFHKSRLELLLNTWISRNLEQTYIFTDGEDEELKKRTGGHTINTNCSAAHSRQALSCKMAVEYDKFIESGKKWFCHVDDDNYVNSRTLVKLLSQYPHAQDIYIGKPSLDRPIEATERISETKVRPVHFWFATGGAGFCISRGLALKMSPWASGGHFMNTAEKIRLPDDCTIGYIIEAVLGVRLIRSNLFHSHLENLQQVLRSDIANQVTLSYGTFENKRNAINMKGGFSVQEDPSRFRSIHCLLYPDTLWCPSNFTY